MDPDKIVMRSVERQDNRQLSMLIKSVMTEFACVGEGYSIEDAEVDRIYESYQPAGHDFWVIANGAKILGCGGIGPLLGGESSVCELKKMYFYPELRGLGWGRRLIERCLESAVQLGYRKCYLETVDRMHDAIRLYERSGFSRLSCRLGDTGHGRCETYFAIELDSQT